MYIAQSIPTIKIELEERKKHGITEYTVKISARPIGHTTASKIFRQHVRAHPIPSVLKRCTIIAQL